MREFLKILLGVWKYFLNFFLQFFFFTSICSWGVRKLSDNFFWRGWRVWKYFQNIWGVWKYFQFFEKTLSSPIPHKKGSPLTQIFQIQILLRPKTKFVVRVTWPTQKHFSTITHLTLFSLQMSLCPYFLKYLLTFLLASHVIDTCLFFFTIVCIWTYYVIVVVLISKKIQPTVRNVRGTVNSLGRNKTLTQHSLIYV